MNAKHYTRSGRLSFFTPWLAEEFLSRAAECLLWRHPGCPHSRIELAEHVGLIEPCDMPKDAVPRREGYGGVMGPEPGMQHYCLTQEGNIVRQRYKGSRSKHINFVAAEVSWSCVRCRRPHNVGVFYAVHPATWRLASAHPDDMLCINCLEAGLGRSVTLADKLPISAPTHPMAARLVDPDFRDFNRVWLEPSHELWQALFDPGVTVSYRALQQQALRRWRKSQAPEFEEIGAAAC